MAESLAVAEEQLAEAVSAADPFISEVTEYLSKAGGKRVRPALALLGACFAGPIAGEAIDAAVAVELIHLGSLYHDDVIDEAASRRGKPSVNANWSNTVAVLAGDYLLSKASEIGARLGREASELLARTLGDLVTGELRELANAYNLDATPEDYWYVIEKKTAALISASIRLGAMVSGVDGGDVEILAEFGRRIGIVFQIADDLLDLTSTPEQLGKPVGTDIYEGIYTLPVLHGLRGPAGAELRELLARNGASAQGAEAGLREPAERSGNGRIPDEDLASIRAILVEHGSIAHSIDEARVSLDLSHAALAKLTEGPAHAALGTLGEYILARVPLLGGPAGYGAQRARGPNGLGGPTG